MKFDRLVAITICSTLLVLLLGGLKPQNSKLLEERYWLKKTFAPATFDIVMVGDSRINHAGSPAAMQIDLPACDVLNFAFGGGGLNKQVYTAAQEKLDPNGVINAIVIGLTPRALTVEAAANSRLNQELGRSRLYRLLRGPLFPLARFLEPAPLTDWIKLLLGSGGSNTANYQARYHDSGWTEGMLLQEDQSLGLNRTRNTFATQQIDAGLVDELIVQTMHWSRRGIDVFAVRVPATRATADLEDALSGFDQHAFVQQFEAAGGVFLEFDPDSYHSYDGSHLRGDAAQQFSRDLARQIRQNSPACTTGKDLK